MTTYPPEDIAEGRRRFKGNPPWPRTEYLEYDTITGHWYIKSINNPNLRPWEEDICAVEEAIRNGVYVEIQPLDRYAELP